ncbi:MAG: hypothetical protein QXL43_01815 [Methanolinea sp.]
MTGSPIIRVRDLDLFYGEQQALKKVNMDVRDRKVAALVGPSCCGSWSLGSWRCSMNSEKRCTAPKCP